MNIYVKRSAFSLQQKEAVLLVAFQSNFKLIGTLETDGELSYSPAMWYSKEAPRFWCHKNASGVS